MNRRMTWGLVYDELCLTTQLTMILQLAIWEPWGFHLRPKHFGHLRCPPHEYGSSFDGFLLLACLLWTNKLQQWKMWCARRSWNVLRDFGGSQRILDFGNGPGTSQCFSTVVVSCTCTVVQYSPVSHLCIHGCPFVLTGTSTTPSRCTCAYFWTGGLAFTAKNTVAQMEPNSTANEL